MPQEPLEERVNTRVRELERQAGEIGFTLVRRERIEELERQAQFDQGGLPLYNRRKLAEDVKSLDQPYAFILIDIDNFKSYNDKHGYEFSNILLDGVALILNRSLRDADLVFHHGSGASRQGYRVGGEEFAALILGYARQAQQREQEQLPVRIAERIRRNVERADWHAITEELLQESGDDHEKAHYIREVQDHISIHPGFNVTVSIGVGYATDKEAIVNAKDEAYAMLRHAKGAGRNKVGNISSGQENGDASPGKII